MLLMVSLTACSALTEFRADMADKLFGEFFKVVRKQRGLD